MLLLKQVHENSSKKLKSNHFDNVIINFYRNVTIAFNFIKVTAKLLHAIRLLKYKRPRRKVHKRISWCSSEHKFQLLHPKNRMALNRLKTQIVRKWVQRVNFSVTISHLHFTILPHTLVSQTPRLSYKINILNSVKQDLLI